MTAIATAVTATQSSHATPLYSLGLTSHAWLATLQRGSTKPASAPRLSSHRTRTAGASSASWNESVMRDSRGPMVVYQIMRTALTACCSFCHISSTKFAGIFGLTCPTYMAATLFRHHRPQCPVHVHRHAGTPFDRLDESIAMPWHMPNRCLYACLYPCLYS